MAPSLPPRVLGPGGPVTAVLKQFSNLRVFMESRGFVLRFYHATAVVVNEVQFHEAKEI